MPWQSGTSVWVTQWFLFTMAEHLIDTALLAFIESIKCLVAPALLSFFLFFLTEVVSTDALAGSERES